MSGYDHSLVCEYCDYIATAITLTEARWKMHDHMKEEHEDAPDDH